MRPHKRVNPYRSIDVAAVAAAAVICFAVGMVAIYAGVRLW